MFYAAAVALFKCPISLAHREGLRFKNPLNGKSKEAIHLPRNYFTTEDLDEEL